MSDVLPPADPGSEVEADRRWAAEQRKARGRKVFFEELEDFGAADDAAGDGDPPDEGDDGRPPADEDASGVRFDRVMISRLYGKTLRLVPISLPDPCPITALGRNGRTYFYLTGKGELIELTDAEHGQAHIAGVWAPHLDALNAAFPQLDQRMKFTGFRANYARDAMMAACALKPTFQAHDKLRGLGCWRGPEGQLVQHLGDRVLAGGEEKRLGEIDGYVYPARPAMVAGDGKDALAATQRIYQRLQGWYWVRGELDARLLLGQLGASVLGAALEWRPMSFLCGDASTGKSTLQRFMRELLPLRLKGTADASEASLRAMLGEDAVAISFDEIEADAESDKAQQVMTLARKAASGDDVYRSGSDQKLRHFTLRGSFIFSAIIPPSMRDADMQRFAMLLLRPLPEGATLAALSAAEAGQLGRALVARITGAWGRWRDTLDAFALGLARVGHAQRSALQFGTLLAGAHVLLHDGPPSPAEVAAWCGRLPRETLFEYQGTIPTWLKALRIVLNAQPEVWRSAGEAPSVADVVRRYLGAKAAAEPELARKAQERLNSIGLAIAGEKASERVYLAIHPDHPGVAALFRSSDFRRVAGGRGAWHIPMTLAPKVEGDFAEKRGVYRAEKVPRLDRSTRCDMFWLDGAAEIGGVKVPIFDRRLDDELVDELVLREPGEEG